MNTATTASSAPNTPSNIAFTMPPFTPRSDDAWWVELFGWKAAFDETSEAESPDARSMRQASLLALLSVA